MADNRHTGDVSRRIADLSPEKRALLARRLRQQESPATPQVIPRRAARSAAPLSFAQQRLWFVDQLEPHNPAYHLPLAVRLDGTLNPQALRWSLGEIARRHEILRTTFAMADGQPVQLIAPPAPVALPLVDLGGLPTHERAAAVTRLAAQEARRPFDLARGPLWRAALLRLGSADHVVLLTMHHIISDGWSLQVLMRELTTLYAARMAGQPAALAELPIQYADYADWQRKWLQAAGESAISPLQAQLAYWKEQLADLATLDLPIAHARPPLQTFTGAHYDFVLPKALHDQLVATSRQAGVTLFMIVLAAYQALLARYSGQHDIVVGAPIAGRTYAETEPLIGCFVNTLVLRTNLAGDPTFQELIGRVRAVCLAAYAHQDVSFEQVVEALQPARDLSRHPLFQTVFVLEHAATAPAAGGPGMRMRSLDVEHRTIQFDLSLSLSESEAGLSGTLEYSSDLFAADLIARMVGHFQTLLTDALAQPNSAISALALLTDAEQQQLLHAGVGPQLQLPQPGSVAQLLAAQFARAPDACALVCDAQHLTYAALNERANQLAHRLRTHGVGQGERVAIALPRSLDLVVALLAVLKAGGAFVPLDPAAPAARQAFMLADSQASVLITRTNFEDKPTSRQADEPITQLMLSVAPDLLVSRTVLDLSVEWPRIVAERIATPAGDADDDAPAYLIYTSGTTGSPKAVMASQRNLRNLLLTSQHHFAFSLADRVPWIAAAAFDITLFELLAPLHGGGTVEILSTDQVLDLPRMAQRLTRYSVLHVVPSLLRQLLPALREAQRAGARYSELRLVCTGGDRVPPELLDELRAVVPHAQLCVFYGPTEATVICARYALPATPAQVPARIGTPLANVLLRVCDRRMRLVPIGVAGELFIGGAGVTAGYLGRPDLTAERFVPNPFLETNAERDTTDRSFVRLYKTGDLVRWHMDGALEFLGRRDDQVKVRGYRIELGEVERVLQQHADVLAAAVVARTTAGGDQRLVAYVVPTNAERRTPNAERDPSIVHRPSSIVQELRAHLQQRLPDYMIPAAFVLLNALPLTPHGKLDRRALPPDEQDAPIAAGDEPRTPAQELLVGIWQQVLGRRDVGVQANFFGLGGHSLLATQVISRVRTVFGVELPLRALFEAPTVAGLAARIALAGQADAGLAAPPLVPVGRGQPLPLSFAQQRLWFLDQLEPNTATYNMPEVVRLREELDITALQHSLNMIVARHEALRTTFALVDGRPVQIIAPPSAVPLPLIDLQALPAAARTTMAQQLASAEAERPFNLAQDAPLRLSLLRFAAQDHIVLLTLHHIVSDGWSLDIFVRELTTCYAATVAGQPAQLPALPIQYGDYAAWQRQWLQGDVLVAQLDYWRRALADLPMLRLPTDYPRPAVQTFAGAVQDIALPKALRDALVALSRQAGVTLFMTLLAAWQLLLRWYTHQDDIVVGTDIANRNRPETEPLIGFFVNQLVLRADLSGDPTFLELLEQVREVCLGAYAHQDLPFDRLVEALNPARNLSYSPLFQVKFVLQNAPTTSPQGLGLPGGLPDIARRSAKFDLLLNMIETEQGLLGSLEYCTDLFAAASINQLLLLFEALLQLIAAQPAARLRQLDDALTAAETTWRAQAEHVIAQANVQNLKKIKRKPVREAL
jgi:amino acid adenylation domain-containing protein